MRRISRPVAVPPLLLSEQVRQDRTQLIAYLRRPIEERRSRRIPINEDFFLDTGLMGAVHDVFENKCAFCESDIGYSGLVHHFRPLRSAEPISGEVGEFYYAWLAYEWQNLVASCPYCAKAKGFAFPLEGSRASYMARFDEVREHEYPFLLDPCVDDPRRHMYFLSDGHCIHKTERGAATIAILDLNRTDLIERRASIIKTRLDLISEMAEGAPAEIFTQQYISRTPHIGALTDILRRLMETWRGARPSDSGARMTFVRNVEREIKSASPVQRRFLKECLDDLRSSDAARGPDLREATAQARPMAVAHTALSKRPIRPTAFDREIATIKIDDFKILDKMELTMPPRRADAAGAPCLAILGENSTGKSTILAAIALALIGSRQARRLRRQIDELVASNDPSQWDQFDYKLVKVQIDFHTYAGSAAFTYDSELRKIDGSPDPMSVVLGYGPRRYFAPQYRRRSAGAHQRVKTLFDPVATIPYPGEWLANLSGPQFDTVARTLRIIFALNEEDEIVNTPDSGLCVQANGRLTPVSWLSEGYRSVFAMVVDILRELLDHYDRIEDARAVVLIDEIETHLHPRWKLQIMTSLRRALPQVQFIVTTHDPLCLRGMDDDEIVVLQRSADNHVYRLDNLPSIKGMTAEQLLTSDYFGLSATTDPKLEIALAQISGDVARIDASGQREIALSAATTQLVGKLTLGDSATEEIVQEALEKFLREREFEKNSLRPDIRAEAVDEVLSALRAPRHAS
jgi:hypothetical protein